MQLLELADTLKINLRVTGAYHAIVVSQSLFIQVACPKTLMKGHFGVRVQEYFGVSACEFNTEV